MVFRASWIVTFRVEDMFFAGTVLQRASQLTGDGSYVELAAEFMLECADRLLQAERALLALPFVSLLSGGVAMVLLLSDSLKHFSVTTEQRRDQLIERHIVASLRSQGRSKTWNPGCGDRW